ncbi:hypothetical protein [Bacillus sp. T33-2]|uniref:hypothetical protein n=1 Tax=Bacillus sp. T33-2 TaxID=2054168 RepID=UPI000C78FEBC|nr:hypothetical protein [Bacillus sp. T33-2]PLR91663.1 hypothetical protein CVD19_21595 [Bacillus sp. T33-2]
MYFPSKKDLWMAIIIWTFIFLFIVPPIFLPGFGVYMLPKILDTGLIRILIACFPMNMLLWIWLKTGYTIKDFVVNIQYGPIKMTIKMEQIGVVPA